MVGNTANLSVRVHSAILRDVESRDPLVFLEHGHLPAMSADISRHDRLEAAARAALLNSEQTPTESTYVGSCRHDRTYLVLFAFVDNIIGCYGSWVRLSQLERELPVGEKELASLLRRHVMRTWMNDSQRRQAVAQCATGQWAHEAETRERLGY